MKRIGIILTGGIVVLVGGYLGLPVLFRYLDAPRPPKRIMVTTADGAAIRVTTSDPGTKIFIVESEDGLTINVTKGSSAGDYVDGTFYVDHHKLDLGVALQHRRSGVLTSFWNPDADGIPTRKAVGSEGGSSQGYTREAIDWIELSKKNKEPNQPPGPMPLTRHGSP